MGHLLLAVYYFVEGKGSLNELTKTEIPSALATVQDVKAKFPGHAEYHCLVNDVTLRQDVWMTLADNAPIPNTNSRTVPIMKLVAQGNNSSK